MSASTAPVPTVAERIRVHLRHLPPAERRVAVVLLGGDPLVGLDPVAGLAARANTSAPTVLRFLGRLGFDGYAAFQAAVKEEIAARLSSPVQMYPGQSGSGLMPRMLDSLVESIRQSQAKLDTDDLRLAVRMLCDSRRRILLIGGRFSGFLAEHLAAHLELLRPEVTVVAPAGRGRAAALLDAGRASTVVAFDYRRYQDDTVGFGRTAADQGAQLLLFTDEYLSPLAGHATLVLPTSVESDSPFDVLTPAVALVETLVAGVIDQLGGPPRDRMARFEELSQSMLAASGQHGVIGLGGGR